MKISDVKVEETPEFAVLGADPKHNYKCEHLSFKLTVRTRDHPCEISIIRDEHGKVVYLGQTLEFFVEYEGEIYGIAIHDPYLFRILPSLSSIRMSPEWRVSSWKELKGKIIRRGNYFPRSLFRPASVFDLRMPDSVADHVPMKFFGNPTVSASITSALVDGKLLRVQFDFDMFDGSGIIEVEMGKEFPWRISRVTIDE